MQVFWIRMDVVKTFTMYKCPFFESDEQHQHFIVAARNITGMSAGFVGFSDGCKKNIPSL